jgi:diguanylate cyclase (GGDEF)-like protein/PAS domain S-box-containing protein
MSKVKGSKAKDTELKLAEVVRKEIIDAFHEITKNVPGVVYQFLMRPDGSFCFPYSSSRATMDIFRVSPDDIRDDASKAFANVHPDDFDSLLASIHASARDLTLWKHEYRAKFDDGTESWLFGNASPQREADNSVLWHGFILDITERKQIETELLATRSQMEATLQALPDTLFELGLDGTIYRFYTHRPEHIPLSAQELIGKRVFDVAPRNAAETIMLAAREANLNGQSHGKQYKYTNSQGIDSWFELSVARKPAYPGQGERFVILLRDITERKHAEEESRIASAAFQSQQPMIITDANSVILRVNQAFVESAGYTAEEAVGKTPRLFKSDRHSADFYRAMWESICLTGGWQGEIWDRRKNGEVYPKWMVISAVKDADGKVTHYIGTHVDISERKKTEQRIESLAFFDQLTGVPNRTLLLDRLKQSIAAGSRSGSCGALLFIDLDHFKTLNDTLGHAMGDMLLKQVAQRLVYCMREGDTVARLGGDEFVVLLAGLGSDERGAAASAKIVAEKILDALSQPYPLGDVAYRSTASVGITLFSVDPITPDELMMQADLAMYRSKAAGRNTIHFFDSHMESEIKERAALEVDLLRAIEERQFLLHYQAQNMSDGRVTGAEVLVRWLHPQRGLVSPAEFIPLAEETGLILPLGQWVLKTACTQLAIWAAQPEMAHLTVAVNVSARQFQANFVDQVLAVLDSTGANPERLKIELTESMLVENVKDIIAKMVALKATGVGFSLDDFGTGYSSLAYLAQLPINQIKIDSSFVGNIPGKESDETIARTIITMSRELGIDVIAEGVETEAQRKFLEFHGCHAFQGYLFSRPLPVREFEKIVKRA